MAEMFAPDQVNLASVVKARRKREENSPRKIKREDGKVVEEQKEVGEAVTEWFKGLFKRKRTQSEESRNYFNEYQTSRTVSEEEKENLRSPVSKEEIELVLRKAKKKKSSIDGLSYEFYLELWEEMGDFY